MNEVPIAKKTRILFVDDDAMLLASTRRQLKRKLPDCDLVFFESAVDALEDINRLVPEIVLSDVRMPGMDGAEFLTKVALICPNSVRLAWTGQSELDQLIRVSEAAHQVFGKPCPTDTLFGIISTVVEFCIENPAASSSQVDTNELNQRLSKFKETFFLIQPE